MWKDFKAFALKGNVMDLAIAVVIGAAFGRIVTSLVENIITPIIGIISGGIDFSALSVTYHDAEIKYGVFLQSVVDFFIIAGAIFLVIRLLMKLQRKKQEEVKEAPAIDAKEALLAEIRDLLKAQK